jgi:hypothetical protein
VEEDVGIGLYVGALGGAGWLLYEESFELIDAFLELEPEREEVSA